MKVEYNKNEKILKLFISEEIDHYMVEKLKNRVDFEMQKYMPKKTIMDFTNVNFMDSAGIGMIIGRYKTAKLINSAFEISNINPPIKKVLEMSGVLKIIPIVGGNKNGEQ